MRRQLGLVAHPLPHLLQPLPAALEIRPQPALLLDRLVHLPARRDGVRSEEHTSELQSLMRISYAVFCLKKKKQADILIDYTHLPNEIRHQGRKETTTDVTNVHLVDSL